MSIRWMTQVLTTLVLAAAATLAAAKPPDLPVKHKVRCEERPGVSAHDGRCVPTQAGYVPGGCIQLDEEQEAGLFEEAEPIELIDTLCPCVGEVLRLWMQALQQAFEVPGDNIVGVQAATQAIAYYPPMPFVVPHVLFDLQGEECNCSKKCKCGNNCECANCTEYCACQAESVGEDEEQAACQCSKGCDCTTDCRCCKGNACSKDCSCGGEDVPGACEFGSFIGSVINQAMAGKIVIHCQCTDNGFCQLDIQVDDAAACGCSKGCSCDAGCGCCKDKVCSKTCTCGTPKRAVFPDGTIGYADGADDFACACSKDCKCEKNCACSKAKSCGKACVCGAKVGARKVTSCATGCAAACTKGCAKACQAKSASACGKGCSEACTGDKACACSKGCKCDTGCECCKDKQCGKGCDCGNTAACCPMQRVIVVIVDNLKDSIRESAVQVKVVEPCNFVKKTRQTCQHGCGQVRKFVKSCVKQMADGMKQAARGENCEQPQPEFPAKDRRADVMHAPKLTMFNARPVKLEKKVSCPFIQKQEADKQARENAKPEPKMAVSVLDNLQKLQRAQHIMRMARWCERLGKDQLAAFHYQRVKKLVPGSRFDVQAGEALAVLEKKQGDVFGLAEEEEQGLTAKEKKVAELIVECRKAIKGRRWDDARKLADQLSLALSTLADGVPEPPPPIPEEQYPEEQDAHFEGCRRGSNAEQTVEEQVAELLEACQRSLADGRLEEAEMLAQQAQMLDPDCVAAHALVYKTHLLIQINQQMQQDAEEQELRQRGCRNSIQQGKPVIFQIELPPLDPGITDALGKIDRNLQTPGAAESCTPREPPFPVPQPEMEDVWPEVGKDPCDNFIELGCVEDCEEECEIMGALTRLIDLMKSGTCVEIGAAPRQGWRLQCQVFVGDAAYSLYADDSGGLRCTMVGCDSATDLRSAQWEHNDSIIHWIDGLNAPQAQ